MAEELICETENCGEEISPGRYTLGYRTCLECGSPAPTRTVAPAFNKGAYQLIERSCVKDIGRS